MKILEEWESISLRGENNFKSSPWSSHVLTKVGRAMISISLLPHLSADRCSPSLFIEQPNTQSFTSLSHRRHEFVYPHAVTTMCVCVCCEARAECFMWVRNCLASLLHGCRQILHGHFYNNGDGWRERYISICRNFHSLVQNSWYP